MTVSGSVPEPTAYSFFGLSPRASPLEIQQAYRRRACKYPADRVWDTPMASVAKTGLQEVERWYALISTDQVRAAYNAQLAARRRPVRTGGEDAAGTSECGGSKSGQEDGEDDDNDDNDDQDQGDASEDTPAKTTMPPTGRTASGGPAVLCAVDKARPVLFRPLALVCLLVLGLVLARARQPALDSPYARLGLPDDTTLDGTGVRAAYHKAVLMLHPDKRHRRDGGGGGGAGAVEMEALHQAYQTLADPYRRCLYETTRRRRTSWDPTGWALQRGCGPLQDAVVGEDDAGDDAVADSIPRRSALATTQPASLVVFSTLRHWWIAVWQGSWKAAGQLLCWMKGRVCPGD